MQTLRRAVLFGLMPILVTLLCVPSVVASGRNPEKKTAVKIPATPTGLSVQDLAGSVTASDLANLLVGEGVTISNVTFIGAQESAGRFSGDPDIVGFDEGIILSSGYAVHVIGPNEFNGVTADNSNPGDQTLSELAGFPTFDASILEFDFVPNDDRVSFQFVFASDEYNEYVNTPYNDVFGFFVNGENCALVESDPVTINTINFGNPAGTPPFSHPDLFRNNSLQDGGGTVDTEMDGLTAILTCSSPVVPNQLNHLKLALADASDFLFDSAVFVKAASFTTERRPVILIPGMTASANWKCMLYAQSCDAPWQWMITADGYYEPLIARLNESGYTEENGYLEILFYDWRQPIAANIAMLKQRVDMVKSATQQNEVDLIGHSMGGLLARAYVQSNRYTNDVAHLVTLGSPHYGAAKSYPYWQAANLYEMSALEKVGINALLLYYRITSAELHAVSILRDQIPSFKDILPTQSYLYWDESDSLIPESTYIHRNSYLPTLNAELNTLFARTSVATFVGQQEITTSKFFVRDRHPSDRPKWDDGEPNWDRINEFRTYLGDGTVTASSATLPFPALVREFPGVSHAELPGNNTVINAAFNFLEISIAPDAVDLIPQTMLAFYMNGPVQATVKDPLGRTLSSSSESSYEVTGSKLYADIQNASSIPGAEYISAPGEQFKLVLIPNPVKGRFEINVGGTASGRYEIGLLDTFGPTPPNIEELSQLWDVSNTQTEPESTVSYSATVLENMSSVIRLVAETPVIEFPLWIGDSIVFGRAVPGNRVEVKDESTELVLGNATADAAGHFAVALNAPLRFGQRIYPLSGGQRGIAVSGQAYAVYLPLTN